MESIPSIESRIIIDYFFDKKKPSEEDLLKLDEASRFAICASLQIITKYNHEKKDK